MKVGLFSSEFASPCRSPVVLAVTVAGEAGELGTVPSIARLLSPTHVGHQPVQPSNQPRVETRMPPKSPASSLTTSSIRHRFNSIVTNPLLIGYRANSYIIHCPFSLSLAPARSSFHVSQPPAHSLFFCPPPLQAPRNGWMPFRLEP